MSSDIMQLLTHIQKKNFLKAIHLKYIFNAKFSKEENVCLLKKGRARTVTQPKYVNWDIVFPLK